MQFHHTTQAPDGDQQDSVVLELEKEALRNILVWADQESSVTVSLTGPMAAQVRQMAKELGLPPEMFIWHAVKVFIEAGAP